MNIKQFIKALKKLPQDEEVNILWVNGLCPFFGETELVLYLSHPVDNWEEIQEELMRQPLETAVSKNILQMYRIPF